MVRVILVSVMSSIEIIRRSMWAVLRGWAVEFAGLDLGCEICLSQGIWPRLMGLNGSFRLVLLVGLG